MPIKQVIDGVAAEVDRRAVERDRLLKLSEALGIAGVGKSTWYDLVSRGEAPAGILLSARCVRWSERAVLQWVHDKVAAAGSQRSAAGRSRARMGRSAS